VKIRLPLVLAAVLLFNPSALPVPLDEQLVYIRWVRFRYNLTDYAEDLLRAQLRKENGRRGSEAGMNPIRPTSYEHPGDPQAYADPTAPSGSEQHGRLARRILGDLQRWVLEDPQRRADFLIWYSARYLAGGKKADWAYFRELQKIYKQEREERKERIRAGREYDPLKEGE